MPRSRSFTSFTMRVGLLHFGQSVDFVVSITFLRSPVLAILAIGSLVSPSWGVSLLTRANILHAASTARSFTHLILQIDGVKAAGLAGFSLHEERETQAPWRSVVVSRRKPVVFKTSKLAPLCGLEREQVCGISIFG